jgi:uncharacterized protein
MSTPAVNVSDPHRIEYLDALRGFAVLGILAINIVSFGVPYGFSVVSPPVDAASTLNLWAWLLNALLVEGTMRGVFALLFGAGILIYTQRREGGSPSALDMHGRRMLWLIAFGLFNSHVLLWRGDILFEYAITGLLLYSLRNWRPYLQIALAVLALMFVTARGTSEWLHMRAAQTAAQPAIAAKEAGLPLSGEMQEALDEWSEVIEGARPSQEALDESTETMGGGFAGIFRFVTEEITDARTITYYRKGVFETGAMLLLGMALFQGGALQSRWTRRRYLQLTLAGYGIGLAINGAECFAILRSQFDPVVTGFTTLVSYQAGRVATALGHVGVFGLLHQSGALPAILARLAAVRRMALTNYLVQSVFGLLLFTGLGLGLYGRLERYELYYAVLGIWILQLAWSAPWLRRFRYGPAEYVWRALVLWRLPSFRRAPGGAGSADFVI